MPRGKRLMVWMAWVPSRVTPKMRSNGAMAWLSTASMAISLFSAMKIRSPGRT